MSTKLSVKKVNPIAKLSRDPALSKGDIETALQRIGQVCAKNLNLDEIIFWCFSQNGDDMAALGAYQAGRKTPLKLKKINSQKIKEYISALQTRLYMTALDTAHKTNKLAREFLRKEIKASLHIPVYINGALGGLVQFNQLKRERDWSLADRVFACEAADLTAATMQNFGMTGLGKYTVDLMDMLDQGLDHILSELDLDYGIIRLDEIPITRGYSPEAEMEFINQYRTSEDIMDRTVIVTNIHQAPDRARKLVDAVRDESVRSFVTAPIIIDMNQVGCVHIASRSIMNWKLEAVAMLEWVASHIARIVDDIWARQDSRTLNGLIQSFQTNSQVLNRMMVFDEAIQEVGKSATEVLETDKAFIILRNPDNTVSAPWISGLDPDRVNRIIDTEGLAVQSILQHGKTPVVFPDVRRSILPTSLQLLLIENKAQSARIFPFVYEGQTLGAVLGFYKQVRLFTRNERNILSVFANSATLTLQNAWMYDQINQGYLGLALALANAVDAREVTFPGSSLRSAKLAEETARALQVPEDEVRRIHLAALLHDIGKKDIPESILQKSGPLNEKEWELVRLSPKTAEKMLEPIPQLHGVARIIRSFHEHFDGSGYPDRLKGDQIPISAKVLAVADAYTSMLENRAYRTSRAPREALQEIQRHSGKYFDPLVVDVFTGVAEKNMSH